MNNLDAINPLVNKVSTLIGSAQGFVAKAVNKGMVLLYWNIGKTIQEEVIKSERAEYGKRIVQTLSAQLVADFGKGYGDRNLWRMVSFYEAFPDFLTVTTLSSQLSWSHIVEILKLKVPIKREFYITMCSNEGWSVELHKSGIHVANYFTELPPIELFKQKLEKSVAEAQKRLNLKRDV